MRAFDNHTGEGPQCLESKKTCPNESKAWRGKLQAAPAGYSGQGASDNTRTDSFYSKYKKCSFLALIQKADIHLWKSNFVR